MQTVGDFKSMSCYFQEDLVTENKIQEHIYFQKFVVILHFMYICLASPSKF